MLASRLGARRDARNCRRHRARSWKPCDRLRRWAAPAERAGERLLTDPTAGAEPGWGAVASWRPSVIGGELSRVW
jgi:hypothetical protein